MIQRAAVALAVLLLTAPVLQAAERAWQTGKWIDVQIVRPKVVFGIMSRDPAGGQRSAPPAAIEERLYVIETDELRLEIKQKANVDLPRIDAMIGEPVTFALEKNTIYIKDASGKEHKFSLAKKTAKTK
jgi:hypothetical protein